MVRIYTDYSKFDLNRVIIDNDSYFYNTITASMLDHFCKKVMEEIDGAVLLDVNLGTIKTKRGITSIDNLSTGTKTVINYILSDCSIDAVNVTQCGWNALEELFKYIDITGKNLPVVLKHKDDVFNCSNREYLINDKKVINNLAFI